MSKLALLGHVVMCRLPEALVAALYAGRRERLGGRVLDPKAQAAGHLANAVRIPGEVPVPTVTRAQMRQLVAHFDQPCPALARKEDLSLPGPGGQIPARLYSDAAPGEPARPLLVYYHGGGWMQGDLETHDGICGKLAAWSGAAVLAIDYRLAPEHEFPAAVEDALAAYRWARENAAELDCDGARVGVGGDSAGGNLAAVVCQHYRDDNATPPPSLQVLIYPSLDGRMNSASIVELADAYIIPLTRMQWYRKTYLGAMTDYEDVRLSPGLAPDLAGLAPAMIVSGGFDPLRDEAFAYADRLDAAGVACIHSHYPGQIHAFISLTKVIPQGNQAIREIAAWLDGVW